MSLQGLDCFSAHNNSHARVAHFGEACSEPRHCEQTVQSLQGTHLATSFQVTVSRSSVQGVVVVHGPWLSSVCVVFSRVP